MSKEIIISPFEIVGSPLCVASDDGQKVYDRIASALREGLRATVTFQNVNSLTSAFLNAAIGQLYGSFSEDEIRARLKVKDLPSEDLALLKRVVDTAKAYFKDPQRFKQAEKAVLGGADA
ncbi:MAG: STAS-like domain-containing protein [Nitrospirota bacterium]|nr:STAS-like domain-containing protein [Nitrospirota bacterium]